MVQLIQEIGSTEKTDLIIFPELCVTGYECGVRFTDLAETVPGHVTLSEIEQASLLDREACAIRDLADEFPDVYICIENARPYLYHSPYCYGESPEALRTQVLNISRLNVRINLDTGHLYLAARFYGFDPVEAVVAMAPLIAHAHVHDNFGLSIHHNEKQQTHLVPFGRGDAHMPVGWGEIPIEAILSVFASSYKGLMITELRSRYFEHTGESLANLKNILENLEAESPLSQNP
jgi:sugar phosphate isomerase/epimerase